jgi:hypothetical protein
VVSGARGVAAIVAVVSLASGELEWCACRSRFLLRCASWSRACLHNSASFTDGQLVSVQLLDDLQADGVYISKNTNISGRGWLVSNRVYVDLGFGATLVLCDSDGNKGVPLTQLKEGGTVKLVKST